MNGNWRHSECEKKQKKIQIGIIIIHIFFCVFSASTHHIRMVSPIRMRYILAKQGIPLIGFTPF